jgi:hypothetical protein
MDEGTFSSHSLLLRFQRGNAAYDPHSDHEVGAFVEARRPRPRHWTLILMAERGANEQGTRLSISVVGNGIDPDPRTEIKGFDTRSFAPPPADSQSLSEEDRRRIREERFHRNRDGRFNVFHFKPDPRHEQTVRAYGGGGVVLRAADFSPFQLIRYTALGVVAALAMHSDLPTIGGAILDVLNALYQVSHKVAILAPLEAAVLSALKAHPMNESDLLDRLNAVLDGPPLTRDELAQILLNLTQVMRRDGTRAAFAVLGEDDLWRSLA